MFLKKICSLLFCVVFVYVCGQLLLLWYAEDVDDDGTSLDFHRGTVIKEEWTHSDEIPARSDMMQQIENMGNGNVEYGFDFDVDRIEHQVKDPVKYAYENELPIILWWTPFTGDGGSVKKCTEGSCLFTQDRSLFGHKLNQVMVFYGTSFNASDLPLPRKADHEWAVLHEESPKNLALFYHEDFISLFNHTATFKQESDYPLTTQYVNSIEELLKSPVSSFSEKSNPSLASTIYLQSGCNPPSDRDSYVNELMKHIKVDSLGACLKNKELPEHLKSPLTMHDDQLREFVGKYKFALTFENAVCDDYITEKLWRPLAAGTIPVYKGAPNIKDWLPDNRSVILVDDFRHPRDLANYLNHLANDEDAYNKYLVFKSTGIKNGKLLTSLRQREWGVNNLNKMSFITGFECVICDRVHKNRKMLKEKGEKQQFVANSKHYGCPKPKVYEFESAPGTEAWERETWQFEYDEARTQARELREFIFKMSHNN